MDATGWDRRYAARPQLWGSEPNVFLAEVVEPLEPGRALDLACGEGRNAIWLGRRGWAVTAVDFSSVAIDRARAHAEHAGVKVDFQIHDVTRWTPPADAFDLVALIYLHIPRVELRAVIARAEASVARGGTLLVVGHHVDNLEGGFGGPQNPEVLYTEEDLASWCRFGVSSARRAERAVDTDDGPAVALDAILVARR